MIETQDIEYKDFSKSEKLDKKSVLSKLYREITAFANATGGVIVVGRDDKTDEVNRQPDDVLKWLENDSLTVEINRISDNLVVFTAEQKSGVVTINIQESSDVISAGIDYKYINKSDCFIRQNHEAVHAKGETLRRLIETKSISVDARLKELRNIVHYKYAVGDSHAQKMNIFDSLVVSVDSDEENINTIFDSLIKNQFLGSYVMPLSKHSTIQMHLETMAALVKQKGSSANILMQKRDAYRKLQESTHFSESFFESHRDSALASVELKKYILEYRSVLVQGNS